MFFITLLVIIAIAYFVVFLFFEKQISSIRVISDYPGKILKILASLLFIVTFFVCRSDVKLILKGMGDYSRLDASSLVTSYTSFISSLLLCLVLFALGEIINRLKK